MAFAEAILDTFKCAIYTRHSDDSFDRCSRLAFVLLSDEHLRFVARKGYPFFTDSQLQPLLICQAHHRCILNAPKFNEQTYRLNLAQYELDERREAQEFVNEFVQSSEGENSSIDNIFDRLSPEDFENLYLRFRNHKETAQDVGENCQSADGKQPSNLENLSATALRRYKKILQIAQSFGSSFKTTVTGRPR